MIESIQIVMLGMARYGDWVRGVTNRQLEVLNDLRRRPDVSSILFVDMRPWRRRDVLKYWWQIRQRPVGKLVRNYGKLSRRLLNVDDKLTVLSSLHISSTALTKDISQAMSKLNMQQPVIWSYVPTSAPIIQQLPYGLVVFDAVDNWLKHRSYQLHAAAVRSGYELFSQIAHCIFTVNLRNASLFRGRDDVIHVPNGVAVGRYQQQYPVPPALAKLPRPIIGYIGTIQDRIDVSLIQELTRQNLGSIVLIGRVWYHYLAKQLAQLPNTHLLGQVPRTNAPAYITNFSVGIVPHKQDDFLASTEALKVYEYLAAGIPVVATTSHEFGNLTEFVLEASTPAAFVEAVQAALAGDNETLRQRRRTAVAECDWSARVDVMLAAIRAKLESA